MPKKPKRKVAIELLDHLGEPEIGNATAPEPLAVVHFQNGKAYLRFGVTSKQYREVSHYVSPDTPASGVFRVMRDD